MSDLPPPSPEQDFRRRIEDLLLYPREDLDVEYKTWLNDSTPEEDRARIAGALIALTNHGGGFLVIGYRRKADGTLEPTSDGRPADLRKYDQDAINGTVEKYAEPNFHCEVRTVAHPGSGEIFPVIRAPGGMRVPVRSARQCPCGRHLSSDVVYIRRPGPQSAPPADGREWDALLARCVRAQKEKLLESIRIIMTGAPPPSPAPRSRIDAARDRLEGWAEDARARFEELAAKLPDPDRFQHGVYWIQYAIVGDFDRPSLRDLEGLLDRVEGKETGWPMWLRFGDPNRRPYPFSENVEAFLGNVPDEDPGHSDFWRFSPEGMGYLVRGHFEDSQREHLEVGKYMDLATPVWRAGEALRHARRVGSALGASDASVVLKMGWEGLNGRALISLDHTRMMWADRISRQPSVQEEISVGVDAIDDSLAELVRKLTTRFFEAFDFFIPPDDLIPAELKKMRENAAARGQP